MFLCKTFYTYIQITDSAEEVVLVDKFFMLLIKRTPFHYLLERVWSYGVNITTLLRFISVFLHTSTLQHQVKNGTAI